MRNSHLFACFIGLLFSVSISANDTAAPPAAMNNTNTPNAPLNLPVLPNNSPPVNSMNANMQAVPVGQPNLQPIPSGYMGMSSDSIAQEQMHAAQAANPSALTSTNDPAFQNVLKKQFPLTPDQIVKLREAMQDTQRATAAPIQPPTPTVSTQTVSLSPGTVPPVIRLATGYVSSIVFVDETGSPWPIVGYSIGNPSAFNVQWDQTSNVLMMQGVGAYQSGNLAVQLTGLSMPVMVTIVNDQKIVDYRVDLRLQGRGPNARASLMSDALPAATTPLLLNLLEGVPPQGSEGLKIQGGNAQAWLYNNMIYLRTRLTVLSPGWNSTMTSPDGMKVYEMNTTPMILASDQGQTVTLKVEGL